MNKTYTISHMHSMYSLLDGLSTIEQIIKRCDKLEINSACITDHNSLSSSIQFFKQMIEAGKKPILGIEFSICQQHSSVKDAENKKLFHQLFYAKRQKGWKDLLNLTYQSNQEKSFYYKPRLSLEEIGELAPQNLITATGHLGSTLASTIIKDDKIQENWESDGIHLVETLKDIFGDDNVLLEIQLIDKEHNPLVLQLGECIRQIGQKTNTKCIASTDSHYAEKEQCYDQRILLCSSMNTSLDKASQTGMSFFNSDNYHIPSYDEMLEYGNTEEELENTKILAECSDYNILSRPILPPADFPPEHGSADEYLRHLCREGWKEKIQHKIPKEQQSIYAERIKEELMTLQSVKLGERTLSDYFLIIRDIIEFSKRMGFIQSPGRGSAAGSFASYLLNLTKIDPIKYNLIFSRFYNAGRNTKDKVSLPDFDLDTSSAGRPKIIEYIKNKYGEDKVTQICTFGKLKGRSALKAVFRAYPDIPFSIINELTRVFPEESKIAAELEEMKDEESGKSIIRYTLEHDKNKKLLKDYCYIDDKGNLQGPLSKKFAQAIRLENCIYSVGIHPSGICILPSSLSETIPVIYNVKNKRIVCGLDMYDAESAGCVKVDILAINMLDKVSGVQHILKTGNIPEEE